MTADSAPETPTSRRVRFLRTLRRPVFTWQLARRLLVGAVIFATVVATFYIVENWRGRRALNRLHAEMRANGEPVSSAEMVPAPIPDEQNFAKAPLWQEV